MKVDLLYHTTVIKESNPAAKILNLLLLVSCRNVIIIIILDNTLLNYKHIVFVFSKKEITFTYRNVFKQWKTFTPFDNL